MRTLYLLPTILVLLFLSKSLSAQEVKGKLVSSSGESIIDGYLICTLKNFHAHSDINGNFTFKKITVGDTLEISHIGFKKYEKVIGQNDFDTEMIIVLEEDYFNLQQVSINNSVNSSSQIVKLDMQLNPVNSSQQVLEKVPGLFISQHAGGGKAEQIFLRGFDIDHGTDITLTVDGMPVNMISHAHGQGYSDLHFVIPETIDNIDFGKGPYYTDKGNFNTAGYVDFKSKDRLEENSFGLEYGQFNTARVFGLIDILGHENSKQNAYIATEYLLTDGPFESPQNFNRFNIMGKYVFTFDNDDKLSIQISKFQSKWDASGQIPQRLVEDRAIGRFGAVDDTEGGTTSRTNIGLQYTKNLSANSFLKTNVYYVDYDFELYSNFTFFLNDPINGDQIKQKENRQIFGQESKLFHSFEFDNFNLETNTGFGFRYDNVDENQLSFTTNRETLRQRLAYGNIDETNIYAYTGADLNFGNWLINPGLRVDFFDFNYVDKLQTSYKTQSNNSFVVSPNLNVIYNPSLYLQLFVKSGFGFHSNDTRVVVARTGEKILPQAFGVDVGAVWKPMSRIWITGALWHLYLEQEFVYVGDEAIVEPSGETRRRGIELGARIQLSDKLYFDTDATYTYARSSEDPEGSNYIPLAPIVTSIGGITYKNRNGLNGAINYRYIMDRPANESNSIVAEGYLILDANVSYRINNITFGLKVENLLDSEWNEAQFATESRLFNELEPVEELHFTPGVPFSMIGRVVYSF